MKYFCSKPLFFLFSILGLMYLSNNLCAQSNASIVRKKIVLPTYDVAPADKKPYFFTGRVYQGAKGEIYPYPMYDVLTDNRHNKEYEGVFLDNKYIEVCVVPELGGRILSALDKTDDYDFFYRQHVVKPALIGMIGAWMSGGVEWNIPDHHRASTMLPVDYSIVENEDGSKTVWVGETEFSRRLRWIVGLTIYPDRSFIEATVKVFNTTPFIQSFLYWANVSVHCDENYQVIFPPSTQFGAQHAKKEFTTWNIGSGRYGGLDRTGVDLSWWKNHPNPTSIFAWNFDDDFLAGYDYKKDAGTVHVANHHIVGGKKFFLWGNNESAKMWEKMLTEKDGQYLELMVGAFSDNQPDYSWIYPGEVRVFKQIWYPVRQIGGVKNANRDAAVNLERISDSKIKVGFYATTKYQNARVNVWTKGHDVYTKTITVDPGTPFLDEINIDPTLKDTDIRVALSDDSGTELIDYQPVTLKEEKMPEPVEVPYDPKQYKSNQELYLTGLRIEQFRNARLNAFPYYEEALSRDSLDYLVNNVMGIRALKEGRFDIAADHFRKSLKRVTKDYTSPKDVETFYYSGVLNKYINRLKDSKDAFWKATWNSGYASVSYFSLAQIACIEQDFPRALDLINNCVSLNTKDVKSKTLKAYILRKLERNKEALVLSNQIAGIDHIYFWNLAEQNFQKKGIWEQPDKDELNMKLHGNVQSLLELVLDYGNIGAYSEAIQLLNIFIGFNNEMSDFPLLYYYRGFYQLKNGDKEAALNSFKLAENAPSNYCFPFRLEEISILETAVETNSEDSKGYYYLGNLYYYLNQKEKAINYWEQSAKSDDQNYLSFRNLGFAYDEFSHDLTKSIDAYEKAIQIDSSDAGLFTELDILYEKKGVDPELRLKLLEKNQHTVEQRDDAIMREIILYNEMGEYDKALDILQKRHFHVWEGGGDIHNIYVNSCLLKGIDEYNKKHFANALNYFKLADTYPDNLEVGRPNNGGRVAEAAYFIGKTLETIGKKTKASEYFRKSADWDGSRRSSELVFYKALSLEKLGNKTEKENLLSEIEKYAQSLLGDEESGESFFSKFGSATDLRKRKAEGHFFMALTYWGKGDKSKAQAEFEETLNLNQNHLWAKVYSSGKIN